MITAVHTLTHDFLTRPLLITRSYRALAASSPKRKRTTIWADGGITSELVCVRNSLVSKHLELAYEEIHRLVKPVARSKTSKMIIFTVF